MSIHEQITASPAVPAEQLEGTQYDRLIAEGLERSRTAGFDLPAAIQQNYAEGVQIDIAERQAEVLQTATYLAESARLDAEFFDKPVNTVLLTAVADSYAENQKRSSSADQAEHAKAEAEKAMLEDVLLLAAGDTSGVVRDMVRDDPVRAGRYAESGVEDPDAKARDAFFESINDAGTAAAVQAFLEEQGEGSFLDAQRKAMNIDPSTEHPFTVKVLKLGTRWELENAGLIEPLPEPDYEPNDTPEAMERNRQLAITSLAEEEKRDALAAPYEQAEKEYDERFEGKFGEISQAFVMHHHDGTMSLTLRAADAHALLNYARDKRPLPEDSAAESAVMDALHITGHEYVHTQKKLLLGNHLQLNMVWEERKAEHLSGEKMAYQDAKELMSDVRDATGVPVLDILREAVRQEDAPGYLMAGLANTVGLRTALLLTAAKPSLYDKNPDHARQFARLDHLMDQSDASALDMIVRDIIERKGDARIRAAATDFVDRYEPDQWEFIVESYLPHRTAQGLGHGARYLADEINRRGYKQKPPR